MSGFWKKLSRSLELPPDAMLPLPRIMVSGDGEVLITGKTALLEYTPGLLRISTELCLVCVSGERLYISAMDKLGICVVGDIKSIHFGE